jgi:hypothetical protein
MRPRPERATGNEVGFGVKGSGFKVQGSGFGDGGWKVRGSRFKVRGLETEGGRGNTPTERRGYNGGAGPRGVGPRDGRVAVASHTVLEEASPGISTMSGPVPRTVTVIRSDTGSAIAAEACHARAATKRAGNVDLSIRGYSVDLAG